MVTDHLLTGMILQVDGTFFFGMWFEKNSGVQPNLACVTGAIKPLSSIIKNPWIYPTLQVLQTSNGWK